MSEGFGGGETRGERGCKKNTSFADPDTHGSGSGIIVTDPDPAKNERADK